MEDRLMVKNTKFPTLVYATDYHEFPNIQDTLRLVNKKFKMVELGFDNNFNSYIGLAYIIGKKPTKTQLTKLTKDCDFI